MRLLILTQKVDKRDPILGFFHRWIEEFSKHYENVVIICLEKGNFNLPSNVKILSLGKETGSSRLKYISRFYKYIWKERKNYDTVFVHMNPEYVVLGGWLWKLLNKKIGLWYVHRQTNLKLKIASLFADSILTSSKESFNLQSSKVHFLGHGIDPDKFPHAGDLDAPLSLVHLGRVTRIKHLETILEAAQILECPVRLVGSPVTSEDKLYKKELLKYKDQIIWDESNDDKKAFVPGAISVNSAPTGGMDKSVLGSLAAGYPTFASNQAFNDVYGECAQVFMFKENDSADLAQKIENFLKLQNKKVIVEDLSRKVMDGYSVEGLINKISNLLE